MKRRTPFMPMVATAMWSAAVWAQSAAPRSVADSQVEQIRALETAFDEAIVRCDVVAIDSMTSDDFTLISLNGNFHVKAEVLRYFAAQAAQASAYEYRKTDELRIRVYGGAAVVTGRTLQTVQQNGKDHSDAYRFTHVYVRQQGRWLLVASQPTGVGPP